MTLITNSKRYQVLTPDGFKPFAGVSEMGSSQILRLRFGNKRVLECNASHQIIRSDGNPVRADKLQIGDLVMTTNGRHTKLQAVKFTTRIEPVFDLIEVEGRHCYLTNGIASHNCSFVSDDATLVSPLLLNRLVSKQPVFFTGTVRWFSEIEPNKAFTVALDPSVGTNRDFAAIQVFQLPEMIQVGEWQHNSTDARGQVRVLLEVLLFLDDQLRNHPDQEGDPQIYWSFENNAIGEAIWQVINHTGEERFPGTLVSERKRKGVIRRFRKGITTTNRNKLSGCARLKTLIESGRMHLHSQGLIRELKNFVATPASFSAKPGEHDDLVMATLVVVRMLDVILQWATDMQDLRECIEDDEIDGDTSEPLPVMIA